MQKHIDLKSLTQKQHELAGQVVLQSRYRPGDIRTVAGMDVHFFPGSEDRFVAAGSLFSYPDLALIETVAVKGKLEKPFPYIPGYLSFREVPALLRVIGSFKQKPDVLLCDGQGIAHPRRIGLAAHLGVLTGMPAVGCAKSHLYGAFDEPPPGVKGAYQFLKDTDGDILGVVLRTRPYVQPLFVSPGHLVDVETASDIILCSCKKYRIPEPLRLAHTACVNALKIKAR